MLDRATRPVAPTFSPWTVCHNDTVFMVLISYFPDLAFLPNAHFHKIVPIRKLRVKYFNTRPSEHIKINRYSHIYTLSNAGKPSAEPIFTIRSTCDWLRTDASAPPYRRVRTVVVVRPYENRHLSPFFRDQRSMISDVWNCVRPCKKTDERKQRKGRVKQKEREQAKRLSLCKTQIAREGAPCSPTRILVQRSPFSGDSFDILTNW